VGKGHAIVDRQDSVVFRFEFEGLAVRSDGCPIRAIRSNGRPLANRGRDKRGESFRIIGERPMIEMPIGGQLRQGLRPDARFPS
jgi:hypothetical protein